MDKIALLIPCYNEEATIGKVLADAKKYIPEAIVYVYDNNSTDKTAEIAIEAGAVVRKEHLQGKGNVIRRMFREVEAECYLMIDGDDTYPLEYAAQMSKLILDSNADMVIGDRLSSTYFMENKRRFHNFGNSLVRAVINQLFKSRIKDIMTGYRAFSYAFVKTFPVLSKGFEIETEMTIHAVFNNMQIENVVVEYRDRPEGSESKLNTVGDGVKVLGMIVKLCKNYRPFAFFNAIAAILSLIAIGFFVPILITYFEIGLVPRYPTLFMCCFIELVAIQAFFSGLILSNMTSKNRRDFEISLLQVDHNKKTLQK